MGVIKKKSKHSIWENKMKFTKLAMLILIAGMLIGAGGCGSAPIFPILWTAVGTTTALSVNIDNTEPPIEYEGGAWYVEPNEAQRYLDEHSSLTLQMKQYITSRGEKHFNTDNPEKGLNIVKFLLSGYILFIML